MSRIKDAEHREKLRRLVSMANFMDDLPSDRLVMGQWTDKDWTESSCGTAACFGGWTATVFGRMGWSFAVFSEVPIPVYRPFGELPRWIDNGLADFYGIEIDESQSLAHGFCCREAGLKDEPLLTQTPRDVARRIRAVVRSYDPSLLDDAPPIFAPQSIESPAALAGASTLE